MFLFRRQSAIDTIRQWLSRSSHVLIFDSGGIDQYMQLMQAVDRLCQSPNEKDIDVLISKALARLRGEFGAVLSRQAEHQAGPISSTELSSFTDSTAYASRYEGYVVSEQPSDDVITYLRYIAKRMNSIGRIGECIEIYKTVRRNFLYSQLKQRGFEELSTRTHVWEKMKVKMESWIQVSKICVEMFQREKKLCEQIFANFAKDECFMGTVKDECFMGTVQDLAVGLFSFVEYMSSSKQSYDRMGVVLGLYDAFLCVLPSANALFSCEAGRGIRNTCAQTLSRMESDVGRMLYDFENHFLNEVLHVYDDDRGVVHNTTCYVMEQVDMIVRNKNLLTTLIKSTPLLKFGNLNIPQEALGDCDNRNFLELHLILIIVILQRNLETKSKSYKNPSLGQLFMMNNIHYILQEIERSNEVKEMIGDSYKRKLNDNFKIAKGSYETSTCNKFLSCFKDEGLYITVCFKSRLSKTAFKMRIQNFNAAFEEVRDLHYIPDLKLKEDVGVSMSGKLVPAYKHFREKFGSYPKIKLIMDDNIQHSVNDLETLLSKTLFAGAKVV